MARRNALIRWFAFSGPIMSSVDSTKTPRPPPDPRPVPDARGTRLQVRHRKRHWSSFEGETAASGRLPAAGSAARRRASSGQLCRRRQFGWRIPGPDCAHCCSYAS